MKIIDLQMNEKGEYEPKEEVKQEKPKTQKAQKPKNQKQMVMKRQIRKPSQPSMNPAQALLKGMDVGLDFVEAFGKRLNRIFK